MPRTNDSFGVFVSSHAVSQQSKEDIHRLCFQTTTGGTFDRKEVTGDERGESADEVYEIGKRVTKYHPFPLKVAPNWDRSACRYSSEFVKKPIGDCIANNQLAAIYKTKSGGTSGKSGAQLNAKSLYEEEFCQTRSLEDLRRAKPEAVVPKPNSMSSTGGRLLFTSSISHQMYQARPELGKSLSAADLRPKGFLEIPRTAPAVPLTSTYGQDFSPKASQRKQRPQH